MSVLTVEVRGHVLHMGLNRAAKRNAFNLELLQALAAARAASAPRRAGTSYFGQWKAAHMTNRYEALLSYY